MKILSLNQLDNSFLLTAARSVGFKLPQTSLLVCQKQDESALDEQQLRAFYVSFTSNTQQQLTYANISLAKTHDIFPISLFCEDFEKYNIRSFADFFANIKSIVKDGKNILVQRTIFAEKSGDVEFKNSEIRIKAKIGMYAKDSEFEEYIFDQNSQEIVPKKIFSQTKRLARDDYTFDLISVPISQEQQTQQKLNTQDKILLRQFIAQLQQLNLKNTVAQFVIENSSIFLIRFINIIENQVKETDLNLQLPFTQVLFLANLNNNLASYIYFNNKSADSSKWIIVKKEQINTLLSMASTYFLRDLKILLDCSGFDIFQIEEVVSVLRSFNYIFGFLVREQDALSIDDLLKLHPKQLLLKVNSLSENLLLQELEYISARCKTIGVDCVFFMQSQDSETILQLLLLEQPLCFEIFDENSILNIYGQIQNCEQKLLFKAAIKILKRKQVC
ncbi:MAG: hypothetical protein COW47_01330 [Candidatus Huberarchaeum crystalense]|uniref:Uncharacterized protein n=1 Tax=Huberarchaeum crystalense TaxID=2014257 RepID=A0A2G9LJC1_HUBC1|nr:hypothetical protein [archaeon]OIP20806.1 MAG: hypothetical protein AUJ91_00320 [archaeon CG2_30_31_98]PIN66629.1 MAG: hypothetical protein COW69_01185 [Candidatus Huberarchaeum crystalense]NCS98500.1 hypothetical protein [archaeon]PIV13499.1 MAG: hypothetical protein COS45_02620 [Candidatus Huberarchaeum crystalense]